MPVPSSELAAPPPLPQASVLPPNETKRGGGQHSLAGEGAGGANLDDRRHCGSLSETGVLEQEVGPTVD